MNHRDPSYTDAPQVLVVDDTPASLKLFTEILTNHGFRVRPASNGKLALRSIAAELPDLVLLDVVMPEMDGYEVCKRIKEDERSKGVPVIFISALEQPADRVKGFQVGAVDFISKPIDALEMVSRIQTHISHRRLSSLLEAQNLRLESEIVEREQKEDELRRYKENLEIMVTDRTREIDEINRKLTFQNLILKTQQESSLDGILIIDENSLVISVNHQFRNIFLIPADAQLLRTEDLVSDHLTAFFSHSGLDISELLNAPHGHEDTGPGEYLLSDGRTLELYTSSMTGPEGVQYGKACFFRDITSRKQMENLLRDKTEELDRFFSLNLDLLSIASQEGYFIRLNPEWEHVLGYSLHELVTRKYLDFVYPEDQEMTRIQAEKAQSESVFRFVNRLIHRDGSYRWIEWNSVPYRELIYASARDITEQRNAERALRLSEERFRTMIEQSPLSMQIMDPQGRTVQVNQSFQDLWGITLEDLSGYNILADTQLMEIGIMPSIRRGFAGESVSIPEVEYDISDTLGKGACRWVQSRIYPVRDSSGTIFNVILVHEDVTLKKMAEKALVRSEEKYRTLVENIHVGVYQVRADEHGRFIWVNQAMADVFGYDSPEEFLLVSPIDLYVNPEDRRQYLERIHREGLVSDYVFLMKKKDQSRIWVSVTAHIRESPDSVQWIDGILEDITASYQVEELKWKAFAQIQKNMEQFAILNDQIRNPLSIILSYLSDSEMPEKEAIEQQVMVIDKLIHRLDTGFLESEKVSSFLRKHQSEIFGNYPEK